MQIIAIATFVLSRQLSRSINLDSLKASPDPPQAHRQSAAYAVYQI